MTQKGGQAIHFYYGDR